ncbi:MAG: zinc ribbon domain-containing protein [Caldiserica bacterium]|jgi:putative FmdB family regulatory protein|nr:zinc ribbon domain-containing protein [Caldisericota bacterium]MDH7562241.1 zinc ribbon domain-containing protein [Caldisericota bacterium]
MPIYEYQCLNCHHRFEFLAGIGFEEQPLVCPRCKSRNLKRLLSRIAFFDSSNSWRAKNGSGGKVKEGKE